MVCGPIKLLSRNRPQSCNGKELSQMPRFHEPHVIVQHIKESPHVNSVRPFLFLPNRSGYLIEYP